MKYPVPTPLILEISRKARDGQPVSVREVFNNYVAGNDGVALEVIERVYENKKA